jgi:hypothetical protein
MLTGFDDTDLLWGGDIALTPDEENVMFWTEAKAKAIFDKDESARPVSSDEGEKDVAAPVTFRSSIHAKTEAESRGSFALLPTGTAAKAVLDESPVPQDTSNKVSIVSGIGGRIALLSNITAKSGAASTPALAMVPRKNKRKSRGGDDCAVNEQKKTQRRYVHQLYVNPDFDLQLPASHSVSLSSNIVVIVNAIESTPSARESARSPSLIRFSSRPPSCGRRTRGYARRSTHVWGTREPTS